MPFVQLPSLTLNFCAGLQNIPAEAPCLPSSILMRGPISQGHGDCLLTKSKFNSNILLKIFASPLCLHILNICFCANVAGLLSLFFSTTFFRANCVFGCVIRLFSPALTIPFLNSHLFGYSASCRNYVLPESLVITKGSNTCTIKFFAKKTPSDIS